MWLLQCLVWSFTPTISLMTPQLGQVWVKLPRNWGKEITAIPHTRKWVHIDPLQDTRLQRSCLFWFWYTRAWTCYLSNMLKGPSISFFTTEASAIFMSMLVIFTLCSRHSQIQVQPSEKPLKTSLGLYRACWVPHNKSEQPQDPQTCQAWILSVANGRNRDMRQ